MLFIIEIITMSVIHETIDDFCEFVDELVELMQEDWERVKKFIKEYKNYVFWFIVLSITMQITDIGTLGRYVDKMCNMERKNVKKIGGGTGDSPNGPPPPPPPPPMVIPSKPQGNLFQNIKSSKGVKPSTVAAFEKGKQLGQQQGQQQAQQAKSKEELALQQQQQTKNEIKDLESSMGKDDELKKTEKQLSFFQRMKQKVSGVDPQGKRIGALGPLFGGMEKAMDYMKNIMAVLTFILTAIGIISLPVFIFLIITYFVIKTIASKLFIL